MIGSTVMLMALGAPNSVDCRVELVGDPSLVASIERRLDLTGVDRTICVDLRIHVGRTPEGVRVAVVSDGQRSARTIADLEAASTVIESWAYMPVETRREPLMNVETDAEPPRVTAMPKRRSAPESDLLLGVSAAGEVAVAMDGTVWYGPAIEATFGADWAGAILVRYGQSSDPHDDAFVGSVTSKLFEGVIMLTRRLYLDSLTIEPRLGFGVRRVTRGAVGYLAVVCERPPCRAGPVPDVHAVDVSRTDMTVEARAVVTWPVHEHLDLWGAVGGTLSLGGHDTLQGVAFAPPRANVALARLTLGGRFRF